MTTCGKDLFDENIKLQEMVCNLSKEKQELQEIICRFEKEIKQKELQVVKIGKRNGICTFCGCENKKPLFQKHSHCKNCGKDLRW